MTLVYPIRPVLREIGMARKLKNTLGQGMYNGAGGKIDMRNGVPEDVITATIREAKQEFGLIVSPHSLKKVAELNIDHSRHDEKLGRLLVHAFLADSFVLGQKIDSEMDDIHWFDYSNLPGNGQMWETDEYWLARALAKEKIVANFVFDENRRLVLPPEIETVKRFEPL